MKTTKGTVIRTVILAVVLLNLVLEAMGIDLIPTVENTLATAAETTAELVSVVAAWWYNNSFTNKAKAADAFLAQLLKEK